MATLRAQVTMDHDSGLAADRVVNNWTFGTDDSDPDQDAPALLITAALNDFYTAMQTDTGGNVGQVSNYLSPLLAGTGSIKVYNLDEPAPRFPITETGLNFTPGNSTSVLPEEVALTLSFQAAKVQGENQDRKRGRVYLGPLDVGAITRVGNRPVVSNGFRGTVLRAAMALKDASDAATSWTWGVSSRGARAYVPDGEGKMRATGAILAPQFRAVAGFWIDDAFDTQRRRGQRPSVKYSQPASGGAIANPAP